MSCIWQNIPSMAFKTGLYDGISTIREARTHGDFGVGQFAALDGELIVRDGSFYRARSDGSVHVAEDSDELCFAQVCFYRPKEKWNAPPNTTDQSFGAFLSSVWPFPNSFCAFRIVGAFSEVVPTSPPALVKPYPVFDAVGALRKAFPVSNIEGCIVGYYSPIFTLDVGIPGFHFHFISDDGSSGGHVTSFSLLKGQIDAARIDEFVLTLPTTADYVNCVLR
jgi:acetolactate decarboxylase